MQLAACRLAQRAIGHGVVYQGENLSRGRLATVAERLNCASERLRVGIPQQRLALSSIGRQQTRGEINTVGHGACVNLAGRVTDRRYTLAVVARTGRLALVGGAIVLLAAAAAAVWFTLLQPAQTSNAPAIAQVGAPAPALTLPVVGGGTSNLAADRGKVVLVNFWATWCEPCKAEMPGLQQLADELSNQPFRLYSVDLQEDAPQILAFEQQYGLRLYAVIDEDGTATRAYGVRALPSTFLIDQKGILHLQRLGPLVTGDASTMWSEPWLADQVRGLLASG
jgi:thiol-disulfide isomerase/thioredoxin